MFYVEKQHGPDWQRVTAKTTLEEAIRWCHYHQNLRSGRVLDASDNILHEDWQPIRMQAVSDQFGFVGYQCQ